MESTTWRGETERERERERMGEARGRKVKIMYQL